MESGGFPSSVTGVLIRRPAHEETDTWRRLESGHHQPRSHRDRPPAPAEERDSADTLISDSGLQMVRQYF